MERNQIDSRFSSFASRDDLDVAALARLTTLMFIEQEDWHWPRP